MKGPLVPPGVYQVQLTLGDQIYTQSFEVLKDPRVTTSQEELQQQYDLLLAIRAKISEVHEAINALRSICRQVDVWEQRTHIQYPRPRCALASSHSSHQWHPAHIENFVSLLVSRASRRS